MLKVAIFALVLAVAQAQFLGGFVPQPVVSAQALDVANWAASSLSQSSNQMHAVFAVKNLATQTVAGTNYKFTLELLVDGKLTKSCDMLIFEQPWTKTRQFIAEPVCKAIESSLGGFQPATVNAEVEQIAKWAASTFTNGQHSVVSISNYRTQMVAGVNHKFTLELLVDGKVSKSCEMSVFTQSWTNTIRMAEEPVCSQSRLAGGYESIAEITPKIKEIASWSASEMSAASNDKHSIVEIKNVQRQLVSGFNYKFTLVLSVNGKIAKTCEMSVFDQEWSNTRKFFAEPRCESSRALVGGFTEQAEVSDKVKEIASWSATQLSSNDNHAIIEIKNVQTQVINGINYKFTLVLSVNGKMTKTCQMSVFDQAWTGTRRFFESPRCF